MPNATDEHGRDVAYEEVVSHHSLRRMARLRARVESFRKPSASFHVIHATRGDRWEVVRG